MDMFVLSQIITVSHRICQRSQKNQTLLFWNLCSAREIMLQHEFSEYYSHLKTRGKTQFKHVLYNNATFTSTILLLDMFVIYLAYLESMLHLLQSRYVINYKQLTKEKLKDH